MFMLMLMVLEVIVKLCSVVLWIILLLLCGMLRSVCM